MKNKIVLLVFGILLAAAMAMPVNAQATSTSYCNLTDIISNTTVRQVINGVETNTTTYTVTHCSLGCRADATYCTGQAQNAGYALPAVVAFIIVALFFFVLSFKFEGESLLKPAFFQMGYLSLGGVMFTIQEIATDFGNSAVAGLFDALIFPYLISIWLIILFMIFNLIEDALKLKREAKKKRALGGLAK